MTLNEKIKAIDHEIEQNKAQYDLENASSIKNIEYSLLGRELK